MGEKGSPSHVNEMRRSGIQGRVGLSGSQGEWDVFVVGSMEQERLGWSLVWKAHKCILIGLNFTLQATGALRRCSREVGLVQFLEAQLKGGAETAISAFQ